MMVVDMAIKERYQVDEKINPGDDFYKYVCGKWMKNNPLPKAYSRYGIFHKLNDENEEKINTILDELEKKNYTNGSIEQKIKDLHALGMNMQQRNNDGVKELIKIFNDIEKVKQIKDLKDIQKNFFYLNFFPMNFYFSADEKNSSMNILYISQGGLSLPEKQYYLSDDEKMKKNREEYKKHIVNMFQLFNFDEQTARKKMELIFNFETELAKISQSEEEQRDCLKNYNKITIDEFCKKYKNIPIIEIFNNKGVKKEALKDLVIRQPEFIAEVNEKISDKNIEEAKSLIEWKFIKTFASYLDDKVIEQNFNFWGKTLLGKAENHTLQKRVLNQVNNFLGMAIGKIFCEKYFPESSKQKMLSMVEFLQTSLAERILAQTWMAEKTKIKALEKLSNFRVKIGYPDQWEDFSELKIDKNKSYFSNVLECIKFWDKKEIEKKAGKPVDKNEWLMEPQMVNAYYNPTTNEICFPAGILQPPFFDPDADDAINFGAIGSVIGHEMTHGFDDQGHLYDKDGDLNPWWLEEDEKAFREKTKVCEDFFSNIKVLPDLNANGKLTLGENIADHGGVKIAFNAYKKATMSKNLEQKNNISQDQQFFISYAFVWATNTTEETIRYLTTIDPHSLGTWRVNGTLPHIDAWYEAFNITEENKLFIKKEDRVNIW